MKFIINFKTYKESSGKNALKLLKILEKSGLPVVACLQPADLHLSKLTKIPVWAQHVDPINYGSHTGWILPENVKDNGAKGVLINHSEHKVKDIKSIVNRCKELKLKTMILVSNAKKVLEVKKFNPDFIGVEPSELIGSKTDSVASKPKLIENSVKNAGKIPLLIGAGVKTKNDCDVGKKLGAKGVLIASAVVKASNPLKVLKSFNNN